MVAMAAEGAAAAASTDASTVTLQLRLRPAETQLQAAAARRMPRTWPVMPERERGRLIRWEQRGEEAGLLLRPGPGADVTPASGGTPSSSHQAQGSLPRVCQRPGTGGAPNSRPTLVFTLVPPPRRRRRRCRRRQSRAPAPPFQRQIREFGEPNHSPSRVPCYPWAI